ncbi:MAG: hypothetical protein ACSLE6_03295 [Mycobacterium sp.]
MTHLFDTRNASEPLAIHAILDGTGALKYSAHDTGPASYTLDEYFG